PIRAGIPRFVLTKDEGQIKTADGFGYQWKQDKTYDSQEFRDVCAEFVLGRYGFSSAAEFRAFFAQHPRVLDAGCGAGVAASLWMTPDWQEETGATWHGA